MAQKIGIPAELANFDDLPDSANVRIKTVKQLYGGVSDATVWRKSGKSIPAPHKLSERITAWNVGEIRADLAKKKGNGSALPSGSEITPPNQLTTTAQLDQEKHIHTAHNRKVRGGNHEQA